MDSEHSSTRFISGNRRNIESDRSQPTLWHGDSSAGQMHFIRLPKTSIPDISTLLRLSAKAVGRWVKRFRGSLDALRQVDVQIKSSKEYSQSASGFLNRR